MSSLGRATKPDAPSGRSRPEDDVPGCPECSSETDGFLAPAVDSSERGAWDQLHSRYHALRRETDRLRGDLIDARVGLASFESLFRISPFPIMEQDYTQAEAWLDNLRHQGVEDIREVLPDIEAIRAAVPLIWIVSANPAAVAAVGLPLHELIGPIDPRIVNDESYPSWISQFEAVWYHATEARTSFTAGTPSGLTYDAESTLAVPVVGDQPDFSRAMFTVVDVTEHRSEERRMEELIATKNRFLASISHEIRTPLTAIVGFSQMLEDDDEMSADDRLTMITAIVEQAREMSDLVNDLLVAARADADTLEVELQPIDLGSQVDQILSAGGAFTEGVAFDAPRQPTVARADPARVRQILRNLLTNAERYGGPSVSVVLNRSEEWIDLEVIDDGAGLPQDEWESIFQLYHRAHNDQDRPESMGIGLAVSRQLAELMEGRLTYERRDDRSVFRLRLPAG
ncbi:MAG TPA: HAMP domain-containing sensor histidine kinase [Acidimicrobiia bacterium]|nr:HAMP domain-containing sensor histidine kinase [Acidimicrobiia bacterium]